MIFKVYSLAVLLGFTTLTFNGNLALTACSCTTDKVDIWIQIPGIQIPSSLGLTPRCFPGSGTIQNISPLRPLKTLIEDLSTVGHAYSIIVSVRPGNSECSAFSTDDVIFNDFGSFSTKRGRASGVPTSGGNAIELDCVTDLGFYNADGERFKYEVLEKEEFNITVLFRICDRDCTTSSVGYNSYTWSESFDIDASSLSDGSTINMGFMRYSGEAMENSSNPIAPCYLYECS